MRTIGFFIMVMLLWPLFQHQEIKESTNNLAGKETSTFKFQIPVSGYPSFTPDTKKKDIDTSQLKKSSWYSNAIKQIEESEYEIKQVDNSNEFASPNRQQNLRAFYTANKFTLEPRADDKWKLELTVKGVYSGKRNIYSPNQKAIAVTNKNNIQFNHNNEFTVEYINSKKGVRQNFIIEKEPFSKPKSISVKLQAGKNWFINRVHPKEIHFAKTNGNSIEKKLTYHDLKVWDAVNNELEAFFTVSKNEISINVNTGNAVYPITIDPISTTANWSVESNQAGAYYGWSVASAGDVNGDGYSDIIVGSETYDSGETNEGKVFVYHGSSTGLSATANWTTESDQISAQMGLNVNTAGDVNGDGYSDIIIGVPRYDSGNTDEGRALVFHGSATGLSATANWTTEINQDNAWYGASVASAGDVNGDGYSDVIVGSPYYDNGNTDEGKAYLYYGSSSGLLTSPAWSAEGNQDGAYFGGTQPGFVGTGVACAGDINGDNFSDILIGASGYDNGEADEGRAFLYQGSVSGLSLTADWTAESDQASAYMGNSLASAGDVNGDGYADVIVGAFAYDNGQSNEGRAYVYYGSASGLSVTANWAAEPDLANSLFGCSVACSGDVNGDGYSDVIVGASIYTNGQSNEGAAFAYLGSATGLSFSYNWIVEGNLAGATLGATLSPAGDVNGDGYSDVLVGAFDYTNGQADEGAAFVYHGSPDGLSASPNNTPDDADQLNAQFGVSVAGAGDVNGDGYSDVIIGAWRFDDGFTDEGVAFVYHGSSAGLNATPNSILDDADQANCFFGETVAGAGDVNGDGYSDVIIGADNYDDENSNEGRAFVYHGSASGLSVSPVWFTDDANQDNAYFGVSVAGAGDVNGDGYGDVIVGAIGITDGGNSNEGKAYVYLGSATGLSSTPNYTPDDADQADAWFGWSVAGAGDVNGDGYSDVIIGAPSFDDAPNTNEGRAFVYFGSATGLSDTPGNIRHDANQAGAWFGVCVAGAGDVNGDGFNDVIIGASLYNDGANTDEGGAFVYYGGPTGISAAPDSTPDDADQATAHFGISVASAGDLNGDGYSDVIIGARYYDGGASNEGQAFVYYGSSTGLSAIPNSTPDDANQADSDFGYSVACAGDVNGDGYSDVIVGAYLYDEGGNTDEGRAFVYYGNNTGGLRNNLRLYNTDLVTPIQQSNIYVPNLFGAGLFAKSPLGRVKGKMVWEVKKEAIPFSGSPITNSVAFTGKQSAFSDLGINGTELKNLVQKINFQNKVRVRVEYDKSTAITGQMYGPWRYPPGYLQGAHGMNSLPLPVKFIFFTAVKDGASAKLKWITTEEEPGVRFEVQHSNDGTNFTALVSFNGKNQTRNEYEWLHTNPAKGNNFYRIKATENNKSVLTATRLLNFDSNLILNIYPNPSATGKLLTIENAGIVQNEKLTVSIFSLSGQNVFQKEFKATENSRLQINIPDLPSGAYLLQMRNGLSEYRGKIIVTED